VKSLVASLAVLLFSFACGVRTPMDCVPGTEGCVSAGYGGALPARAGTGGQWEAGGTLGAGGDSSSGGQPGLGGATASGGVVGYGGLDSSGGSVSVGGVLGSGGTMATGGRIGSGGVPGSGGRLGSGGDGAGTIGTGGLGPGGVSGTTGNTVTFLDDRAEGAMTGYGWVALGQLDTFSSPTCMGGAHITPNTPCDIYDWSSGTALCMSGTIPAVTNGDYTTNWGVLLAAEVTDPEGGGLGQSFQAMTINLTGTPRTGIRAVVHRIGDAGDVNYCATIDAGSSVLLTSFNTHCWDGSGLALAQSDVPDLDWVGIQVPSAAFSAITVTNLCLTGIVFK